MCLAVPTRIMQLKANNMAITSLAGVEKEISLALLAQAVRVGDYVIVHAGYALNKLDEADAQKTLAYFAELKNMELENGA